MATVSYVRITAANGTVLSGDGAAWTPVTGLSFGATDNHSDGSAGKAALGDLSFALPQSSSIAPQLKLALAQGNAVKVEVATYDPSTATATSVGTLQSYDVFGSVAVSAGVAALHMETLTGGVADVYTVTPASVSQASYGGGAQTSASAYSVVSKAALPPVAAPTDVAAGTIAAGAAPSQSSLTYYVEFKTASGSYVAGANGSTWFAVTGLSSELEQTLNVGNGTGAGKVGFDPASFTLADTSVDPQLFAAEAAGTFYKDVQIEAVGANGKVVDSTTLGTVGISAIGQGQSPRVTLQYGSTYTQHVSAGGAVTGSGWDKIHNVATSSTTADPIVQLNTGAATQAAATTNFISFTPYNAPTLSGDSSVTAPDPASALTKPFASGTLFAATDVAFDTTQSLNISSQSSGAGAGKVAFDPLDFTVAATPQSAVLDTDLFSGATFKTVALGTASAGVTSEVDTLKLVAVEEDSLDLVAGTHSLELEYGALQEQTAVKATSGSVVANPLLGWNRVINLADNTTASLDPTGKPTTTSTTAGSTVKTLSTSTPASPANTASNPNVSVLPAAAGSGSQSSAPTTNTAYVQFRDASGNVITDGANGASWFKLSSASTAFEQLLNIGTGSTGSGAGKATFGSLALALGPDAITAQLDKTLGTGGLTAEVASYSGSTLLNDYVFGGASLQTDTPSATGSALSLNYTGFQETPYASSAAGAPVTWNTATNSSAYSAKVAAPTSSTPQTFKTPTQLVTYAEFVGADGKLIAGSNGKTLFATRNVSSHGLYGPSSGGAPGVTSLSLSLGDDAVVSTLETGLGSKVAPVGVVLVSVDAANPKNVVSQQTYGDVYLSGDTLDNTGGDHRLTFQSASALGAAYSGALAPAGYTEQVADDYRPDGTTGYSTAAGGALPSAAIIRTGLPPGPAPAYQSFTGESFSAGIGSADGTTSYTGAASSGLLSASNVSIDFAAHTGSFSVAASALPGLTQALTAAAPVAVTLQSALNGNTEGLVFGGTSGTGSAHLTGAKLDAATGLADVSFAFSGATNSYASGGGGSVLGVETYPDQMVVTAQPVGATDLPTFDISFTNGLAPASFDASDLQIVDGSGGTVAGTISVGPGATPGTYVASVLGPTGSGAFTVDGTAAFKTNGVAGHSLSATDQVGSDSLTTNSDRSQSFTVATPGSPTTTTAFSSEFPFGIRTQTVVLNPDPSTAQVTTTYASDGTTATKTDTVLADGADVVVTPGTAGDPSGTGGSITNTYASPSGALLYTVYQRADGTAAERVDDTGSGTKTTVYATDGTTPVSVVTAYPDGTSEVYQALSTGPFASSDDLYDATGTLTQATYTRAGGILAEVDTFGTGGSKTVALYDATGAPLETTVTNADGTSAVTQYEAAGPYASVTTTYGATGTQIGQTEAARAPDVALDGAGGAVTTPTVTVTGRVDIPGVAGTVQFAVNGAAAGAPVTLNPDGTFSAVLPFAANGTYDVTATTAAGGVGTAAAPVEYTVSDIAPTVAFTSAPATGASAERTITGTVVPSGTATVAGQTVTLTENGVALATAQPVTVAPDGTFTAAVTLTGEGADAVQASVTDSLGNAASAAIVETLDQVAPVVSSPSLTVAPGAGPTAVGIAAPSDDVTAQGALTIVVGGLPGDGTLTLADGETPVTAGMSLTAAQLGGLLFTPTPGLADQSATFVFTVADGAGNASTGTATLAIGDAAPSPSPGSTAAAPTASPGSTAAEPTPSSDSTGAAPSPSSAASILPAPITTANADGSSTTVTFDADGSSVATTSGGSAFDGKRYSATALTHAADGTLLDAVRDRNDGSHGVGVFAGHQTLQSDFFDIFYNGKQEDNAFVFDPGHGLDVVDGFKLSGVGHDLLSFKGTDFGNDIANVLAHTYNAKGGAVIVDPTTHDAVKLDGVFKKQLVASQNDIAFHA